MRLDLGSGRDARARIMLGDLLEIIVTGPCGTGHLWDLRFQSCQCRMVSRTNLPNIASFGASVSVRFVVELITIGEFELHLQLQAPWESAPLRDHVVTVCTKVEGHSDDGAE